MSDDEQMEGSLIRATGAVTIQRDGASLYDAWRKLIDLRPALDTIVDVRVIDDLHSEWTVSGPAGQIYRWNAELKSEEPGRLLSWRTSDEESDAPSVGSIRFDELPEGRGTEVRVVLEYRPPNGGFGDAIARQFGADASSQLRLALHRFRQLMETGEVAVSSARSAHANWLTSDRSEDAVRREPETPADVIEKGSSSL